MTERKHRTIHPWKHTGNDRGHQRRIAAANARDEYTPLGTKSNATDQDWVASKRAKRREWA